MRRARRLGLKSGAFKLLGMPLAVVVAQRMHGGAPKIPEPPRTILEAALEGATEAMRSGPEGYPFEDIEVVVTGIEYRPDATRPAGQRAAVGEALRHASREAGTRLLEPIMNVEVQCPQQFMGDITGIINSKRGRITGMDSVGDFQIVKAEVPHGEMFKFCGELRSITGGRGSYCMEFAHYAEVPSNIGQAVVEAHKKSRKQPEE